MLWVFIQNKYHSKTLLKQADLTCGHPTPPHLVADDWLRGVTGDRWVGWLGWQLFGWWTGWLVWIVDYAHSSLPPSGASKHHHDHPYPP